MNPSQILWPKRKLGVDVYSALILCLAGVAGALALSWVGFIGSDDAEYYAAGKALSRAFWMAPDGFGGMRSAVSMPIAVSLKLFGDHEWSLILPTCLYALATAAVSFLALARLVPARMALAATLLFMTLPVVATTSTVASADIAELFWAVCAFWLLVEASRSEGRRQDHVVVMVGASIGLAFAARETAAAMVLWLGVGFLFGYALPRMKYFWSALGFIAIMALECLYFAISSGNPFARFGALVGTRSAASRMVVPPFTYDDTGNLRIHDLVDPLVMMFTKHSFGALYWVLLVAGIAAWLARKHSRATPMPQMKTANPAVLALILALIWSVFTAVALVKLRIHARYYVAPTYFLVVAATLWLSRRPAAPGRAWLVAAAVVILGVGNFVGIWVENRNPRFAERTLADIARAYPEPIHTDAATAYIATVFQRWNGGPADQIVNTAPGAGQLQFRVLAGIGAANRQRSEAVDIAQPVVVLERRASPPLVPGTAGTWLSRSAWIPEPLRNKLVASRSEAQLVRLGDRVGK